MEILPTGRVPPSLPLDPGGIRTGVVGEIGQIQSTSSHFSFLFITLPPNCACQQALSTKLSSGVTSHRVKAMVCAMGR